MKQPLTIVLLIGLAIFLGYIYVVKSDQALTDEDFTNPMEYVCADENTIGVAFADNVVRLSLSDQRVYVLDAISASDEQGVLFANKDRTVQFWMKDDSAFLEESGVTTYGACRVTLGSRTHLKINRWG